MVEWLGHREGDEAALAAASRTETAGASIRRDGTHLTPDLGGDPRTAAVGDAVARAL